MQVNRLILISIMVINMTKINAKFTLVSSAFAHGAQIPSKYTCDGANISPQLSWSDAPQATKSFALIVDDPDAPAKTWVHWVVFNIPATIAQLPEDVHSGDFLLGSSDFTKGASAPTPYGGPCLPSGTHRY